MIPVAEILTLFAKELVTPVYCFSSERAVSRVCRSWRFLRFLNSLRTFLPAPFFLTLSLIFNPGFNVSTANNKGCASQSIKVDAYQVPGFQQLQWLMCRHVTVPDINFLLLAMLMGRPVTRIPCGLQVTHFRIFNLISLQSYWCACARNMHCQKFQLSDVPRALLRK